MQVNRWGGVGACIHQEKTYLLPPTYQRIIFVLEDPLFSLWYYSL